MNVDELIKNKSEEQALDALVDTVLEEQRIRHLLCEYGMAQLLIYIRMYRQAMGIYNQLIQLDNKSLGDAFLLEWNHQGYVPKDVLESIYAYSNIVELLGEYS